MLARLASSTLPAAELGGMRGIVWGHLRVSSLQEITPGFEEHSSSSISADRSVPAIFADEQQALYLCPSQSQLARFSTGQWAHRLGKV